MVVDMNKDFHYYGTYLAAIGAGFSAAEARKIAWAAQMTDDCTQSLLDSTRGSQHWAHRVVTCQSLLEMSASNMHSMSGVDSAELKKVRNIWMPFHFLPGNLAQVQKYTGETTWGTSVYDPVRDGADFQCICLHNSDLVYRMVDDTCARCSTGGDAATADKLLYLIGIRMHVLADTWAHEFFAGTPNYWVNEVEEIIQLDGRSIRTGAAPDGVSYYSLFYLGHGQAGHYPDYGYIAYQFRPHWMRESSALIKNNPLLFLAAFCQMLDAMTAIRTAGNFPRGCEYDVPSERVLVPRYGITAGDVLAALKTPDADQSPAWKNLLTGKGVVADVNAFDYRTDDPLYSLERFCECAEIQRNLVARYLEQAGIGVEL